MNTVEELIDLIEIKGVAGAIRATRRPPLPTRLLRELYQDFRDREQFLLFVASYPLAPSDLAEQVGVQHGDNEKVATALAGNPRTPPVALQRLAGSAFDAVRVALASHPNLGPREFQSLAASADPAIRAAVASHPNLPIGWQLMLSADTEPKVRACLAARKGIDTDIAVRLSSDEDRTVRSTLLSNPDLHPEIRQMQADLDDPLSQQVLLDVKVDMPDSVWQSLRLAADPLIRQRALQAQPPSGPEILMLAESDDTSDRLFAAGLAALPVAIQRILAGDTSPKVRRRLAAHPQLDESIALQIAASEDSTAAIALAANPNLRPSTIIALCSHSNDAVADILCSRSDLTESHWQILVHRQNISAAELLAFDRIPFAAIKDWRASELAVSCFPSARAFAAGSRHLPTADFKILLSDRSPQVRRAVASNPAAPAEVLHELAGDNDRELAFAAEDSLRAARKFKP